MDDVSQVKMTEMREFTSDSKKDIRALATAGAGVRLHTKYSTVSLESINEIRAAISVLQVAKDWLNEKAETSDE